MIRFLINSKLFQTVWNGLKRFELQTIVNGLKRFQTVWNSFETAQKVYRPDVWKKAADLLVEEGKLAASDVPSTDGYKPAAADFIDGTEYDGKKPNEYLSKFEIGNKDM